MLTRLTRRWAVSDKLVNTPGVTPDVGSGVSSTDKGDKGNPLVSMGYSGPIPPPQLMEGYKNVLDDAPDRILKMAEKQTDCMVRDSKLQMYEMWITAILTTLSSSRKTRTIW